MRISTQRVLKTLLVAVFALCTHWAMASSIDPANSEGSATTQPTEVGGQTSAEAEQAQSSKPHTVTGVVLDENGKPMGGVGIIIPATMQGVVTDIDGKYSIKAAPEQSIEFSFLGYKSEVVVRFLSDQGVYVSSGSACHKGKPSHVYAALKLPKKEQDGVLRVSFSYDTTREDVDALVQALKQAQSQLFTSLS